MNSLSNLNSDFQKTVDLDNIQHKAKILFYFIRDNEINFIMIREKDNEFCKNKIKLNAIGGTYETKDKTLYTTIYREINEETINIISQETMEKLVETYKNTIKYITFSRNKSRKIRNQKVKEIHKTFLFFIPWDSEILRLDPNTFISEFYFRKNSSDKLSFVPKINYKRYFELDDIEIVHLNSFSKHNINNFLYSKCNRYLNKIS